MKLYAPSYYEKFKCIGGECSHNCCIGWEIDVDTATMKKYDLLDRTKGERICESIYTDGDGAHFRLTDGGRCPHLNACNLCDIIIRHGEDLLCDICREHPRFYTLLHGRAEVGVGLACPAAAKLVLDCDNPSVVYVGAFEKAGEQVEQTAEQNEPTGEERHRRDAEHVLLAFRESIYRMMGDLTPYGLCHYVDGLAFSTVSDITFDIICGFTVDEECFDPFYFMKKRISTPKFNAETEGESLISLLSSLEVLEESFREEMICAVRSIGRVRSGFAEFVRKGGGAYFKRLLSYFIYRHLLVGVEDGSAPMRARAAVIYAALVTLLGYLRGGGREHLVLAAVDFSRNIEYSDLNMGAVIDAIEYDSSLGVGLLADAMR